MSPLDPLDPLLDYNGIHDETEVTAWRAERPPQGSTLSQSYPKEWVDGKFDVSCLEMLSQSEA